MPEAHALSLLGQRDAQLNLPMNPPLAQGEKGGQDPCAWGLGRQPGRGSEAGSAVTAGPAGLTAGRRYPEQRGRRNQQEPGSVPRVPHPVFASPHLLLLCSPHPGRSRQANTSHLPCGGARPPLLKPVSAPAWTTAEPGSRWQCRLEGPPALLTKRNLSSWLLVACEEGFLNTGQ